MDLLRLQISEIKPDVAEAAKWVNGFFSRTSGPLALKFEVELDGSPRITKLGSRTSAAAAAKAKGRRGSILGHGGSDSALHAAASANGQQVYDVKCGGKAMSLTLGSIGVQLLVAQKRGAPSSTTLQYEQIMSATAQGGDHEDDGVATTLVIAMKDGEKTTYISAVAQEICLEVLIKLEQIDSAKKREMTNSRLRTMAERSSSEEDDSDDESSSEDESSDDDRFKRADDSSDDDSVDTDSSNDDDDVDDDDGAVGTGLKASPPLQSALKSKSKSSSKKAGGLGARSLSFEETVSYDDGSFDGRQTPTTSPAGKERRTKTAKQEEPQHSAKSKQEPEPEPEPEPETEPEMEPAAAQGHNSSASTGDGSRSGEIELLRQLADAVKQKDSAEAAAESVRQALILEQKKGKRSETARQEMFQELQKREDSVAAQQELAVENARLREQLLVAEEAGAAAVAAAAAAAESAAEAATESEAAKHTRGEEWESKAAALRARLSIPLIVGDADDVWEAAVDELERRLEAALASKEQTELELASARAAATTTTTAAAAAAEMEKNVTQSESVDKTTPAAAAAEEAIPPDVATARTSPSAAPASTPKQKRASKQKRAKSKNGRAAAAAGQEGPTLQELQVLIKQA
eukprot:COSAG06_NODE_8970_length_2022_cov_1.430057_1_plen_633_part_01